MIRPYHRIHGTLAAHGEWHTTPAESVASPYRPVSIWRVFI